MTGEEFRSRLRQRADAAAVVLSATVCSKIEAYYFLLNHWNKRINLTSIDLALLSDHGIDRLLIEPLVAARHFPELPLDWYDLGSGGGSPAVPLKIARPDTKLTLIESRSRKAAFLREVVRELALTETEVISDRLEHVSVVSPSGAADLITVRGVRVDSKLVQAATQLLRKDGQLWLFSTSAAAQDIAMSTFGSTTIPLIPGSSQLVVFRRD